MNMTYVLLLHKGEVLLPKLTVSSFKQIPADQWQNLVVSAAIPPSQQHCLLPSGMCRESFRCESLWDGEGRGRSHPPSWAQEDHLQGAEAGAKETVSWGKARAQARTRLQFKCCGSLELDQITSSTALLHLVPHMSCTVSTLQESSRGLQSDGTVEV